MLGAIVGDIVGSRFYTGNYSKTKDFPLFYSGCSYTDDSVLTIAVAKAVLESAPSYEKLSSNAVKYMQAIGRDHPYCGFSGRFSQWLFTDDPKPYQGLTNGASMRVSACGLAAKTLDEALLLARKVTQISHDHPKGIKGAQAITAAVWLAGHGKSIKEIKEHIHKNYYPMDFTLDQIRSNYKFDCTCEGSVPQAIMAFLESTDFEDAIRNAVFLGGDTDTIGAMAGSIAEAFYGIPKPIRKTTLTYLDDSFIHIITEFEKIYPSKIETHIN